MISHRARDLTLNRLGVGQWYSNKVLKGAGSSPDISFDVELLSEEKFPARGRSLIEPKPVVLQEASASQLLQDLNLPSSDNIQKTNDVVIDSSEPVRGAVGHTEAGEAFCLRRYQAGSLCIVIDSATDFPSPHEVALLHNMLSACGVLCDERPQLLGIFNWPVFNLAALPVNASSTVSNLVTRWISDKSAGNSKLTILMGKGACKFGKDNEPEDKIGYELKLDISPMDMISMPAKKALVWRQLLPHLSDIRQHAGE